MTTAQTEARAVESVRKWLDGGCSSWGLPSQQIEMLLSALAAKDAEIAALKKEASKFAEWVQDYSNDGHIARAARSFLNKMERRDG